MPFYAASDRFIETPRGFVMEIVHYTNEGKPFKVRTELVWKPDFGEKLNKSHMNAQEFVDSEILRLSNKYVPKVTSMLIRSGILGTEVGSGEVAWIAPYAHYQYTLENRKTSQNINDAFSPSEPKWFERAMAIHFDEIMEGVEKRLARGVA